MFRWYGEAQVCYVYLVDVPSQEYSELPTTDAQSEGLSMPVVSLCNSKWFTRGWTLQELIAPRRLIFFDKTWTRIFSVDKHYHTNINAISLIEQITGIEGWDRYWQKSEEWMNTSLERVPVATKLSWVSRRHTTRVEDMAYCLLGFLDVNMPLLYGEGYRAFLRLQEEFFKKHHDPTILGWGFGMGHLEISDIEKKFGRDNLARTPLLFRGFRGVGLRQLDHGRSKRKPRLGWAVTPYGLNMELSVVKLDAKHDLYIGIASRITLNKGSSEGYLSIPLSRHRDSDSFSRIDNCSTFCLTRLERTAEAGRSKTKKFCLDSKLKPENLRLKTLCLHNRGFSFDAPLRMLLTHAVGTAPIEADGFIFDSVYPPAEVVQYYDQLITKHRSVIGEQHAVMVLHRKRRDTLYLQLTYPIYKPRGWGSRECNILLCLGSYHDRRSAIEVWDAGREPWKRCFPYPQQLNWQRAILTVNIADQVERISTTFYRSDISGQDVEVVILEVEGL